MDGHDETALGKPDLPGTGAPGWSIADAARWKETTPNPGSWAAETDGESMSIRVNGEVGPAVDTMAPTVTSIVRQTPTSSPTNADSLTWQVTFSENVKNVTAADFAIAGTTATTATLTVTEVTASTVYDVTASAGDLAGLDATVTLSIVSGQDIADTSTSENVLSNTTPTVTNDNTYVVDNTAPTVAITDVPSTSRRVFVAGHRGMVGSAIARALTRHDCEVLTVTRAELDLRRREPVEAWMTAQRPDAVFLAAARVGGILANDRRPAEFLFDNLAIQSAVIESARLAGVAKLVFLGSSCIYPGACPQPMPEEALLTGPLEPTNEWYAVAKIAGIKLCQAYRRQHGCNFISLMPANLYGPGDNFDLDSAHVVPALMRRMHEARVAGRGEATVWGSGTPRREFLHVDDLAAAALFLMERYAGERPLNVGTGRDLTIGALAEAIRGIVGFEGRLVHDRSKPDGAPRRLLDITRMNRLGWRAKVELRPGLARTYRWFLDAGPASMAQV